MTVFEIGSSERWSKDEAKRVVAVSEQIAVGDVADYSRQSKKAGATVEIEQQ